ncbi:MAG: class I SAM-dependent methyltransferase [Nanoarchaeota archaeon]|nr:class I SAM-dependent methyltransferase [Nanoarchaeota archaeon]
MSEDFDDFTLRAIEEETQRDLNRFYSQKMSLYDSAMRIFKKNISNLDLIYQMNQRVPEGSLLDAGTGTGENLQYISQEYVVEACDINKDMLKEARNRYQDKKNITFTKADLRHLPYPDQSFDAVVCSYALSGSANYLKAFQELIRVTKKGGFIGVLDFLYYHEYPPGGFGGINLEGLIDRTSLPLVYQEQAEASTLKVGLYVLKKE